jgi:hypothetical protein
MQVDPLQQQLLISPQQRLLQTAATPLLVCHWQQRQNLQPTLLLVSH